MKPDGIAFIQRLGIPFEFSSAAFKHDYACALSCEFRGERDAGGT